MKKIHILIFVLFVFFAGCSDDKDRIELAIAETGCMNAWDDYGSGNNDYRYAVQKYLEDNNISVYRISSVIYSEGPFCEACYCPTGRLIIISIAEEDQEKAEALGFVLYDKDENPNPRNE